MVLLPIHFNTSIQYCSNHVYLAILYVLQYRCKCSNNNYIEKLKIKIDASMYDVAFTGIVQLVQNGCHDGNAENIWQKICARVIVIKINSAITFQSCMMIEIMYKIVTVACSVSNNRQPSSFFSINGNPKSGGAKTPPAPPVPTPLYSM